MDQKSDYSLFNQFKDEKNHPHPSNSHLVKSVLTPDDVSFIQEMIDIRIRAAISPSKPAQSSQAKDYHTAEAIRDLIRQHYAEFREWVGDHPFRLEVLRCFLKRKITLLPGDHDKLSSDKNLMRFDRQVSNALDHWKDSPFQKSKSRKSCYEARQ